MAGCSKERETGSLSRRSSLSENTLSLSVGPHGLKGEQRHRGHFYFVISFLWSKPAGFYSLNVESEHWASYVRRPPGRPCLLLCMANIHIQVEERILLVASIPCMLVGFVFGCVLIVNVLFTKSLHKPRHLFQALSVSSSLMRLVIELVPPWNFSFKNFTTVSICLIRPESKFSTFMTNKYTIK